MNDTAVHSLDINAGITSTMPDSPGAYLSSLRQEAGLTQHQVAESLLLTVHYVNALEHDEYHKLPGKIFVKGYLKSYAQLMDVATDPVVRSFESLSNERNDFSQNLFNTQNKFKSNRHGWIWFVLAGLLLTAIAAASWFFWSGNQQPSSQAQQGLVPDYLRAADNDKQEVVVSIPVGSQVYTVRSPVNAPQAKSSAENDTVESAVMPVHPQRVKPELSEEDDQRLIPASTASRLEG